MEKEKKPTIEIKIVKGLPEENCIHISQLLKENLTKVLYYVQLFIEPTLLKKIIEKELKISQEELKKVNFLYKLSIFKIRF